MYNLRNNFDVIFDMKSQILHCGLFLWAAVMTVAIYGTQNMSYKIENKVILTNFRELSKDDYLRKPEINTKNDLINKWLCPPPPTQSSSSSVGFPVATPLFNESWGPDNVCRCFRTSNCTTTTECAALETSCYKKVVPQYANVYAGVETPYFSVMAAFLLLHISVLLNMTIEVIPDKREEVENNDGDENTKLLAPPVELSTNPEVVVYQASRFRYFATGGKDTDGNDIVVPVQNENATDRTDRPRCSMEMLSDALKNLMARFVVLFLLSIGVLVITIYAYTEKVAQRGKDQVCDDKSMCLTETVLFVGITTLSVFATGWSVFCIVYAQHTTLRMGSRVLEEVTLVAACMLLVASFTALTGVHDDTTILFDVVTVLFIGFVQSLQHKVMLLRETVIKHCEKSTLELSDGLGKKHSLSTEVLAYFLHTRLFIFVVIVTSTYVFFERIEPTLGPRDSSSTWNSYMRNVALLVSLIPNLSCDISYEFFHMREMQVKGEHLTYTGAAMWRRTIYLLYIILFVFAEGTTYNDRPMDLPP